MTPDPPDAGFRFEEELRRVAETRSRGLSGHPSPQELVDYHLGTLPPEEAEALQDHLIYCRECAQVVLDLAAFSRPAPPSADIGREWQRLQARLDAEESRKSRRSASRGLPLALAASLLLTIGLLGWNLRLRHGLEEAHRPRADYAYANLAPAAPGAERSLEDPVSVKVRPNQSSVLLLLNLGDIDDYPGYRIELTDPGEAAFWVVPGAVRSEEGTFPFAIPAEKLEPKPYEIRLYGEREGQSTLLAEYSFEVVRSP